MPGSLLKILFGSVMRMRILQYLVIHGEGYATGMAEVVNIALFGVQNQLYHMEKAGVLKSRKTGMRRMFRFNTRHPLAPELLALLRKSLRYFPAPKVAKRIRGRRGRRKNG